MYRYLVLFLGGAALGYFGARFLVLSENSIVREGAGVSKMFENSLDERLANIDLRKTWNAAQERLSLAIGEAWPFGSGNSGFDASQAQVKPTTGRDPWRAMNDEFEETLPAMPQEYSLCNAVEEAQARKERESCLAASQKAPQFWKSLDDAEAQTIALLQLGNLQEISKYIACDAQDLTWYEIHCLSDIVKIRSEHIEDMLEFADARVLAEARWTREINSEQVAESEKLDASQRLPASDVGTGSKQEQLFQLPADAQLGSAKMSEATSRAKASQELAGVQMSNQWRARSRLISQSLRIGAPWSSEEQAQESRTLILLEEKKDGRVYLSGVPVTGIEKTRNQSLY